MLKIVLYVLAACLLAMPIAAWVYIVEMACGYQTSSSGCGVQLVDFWDAEFLTIAAIPWLLGLFCLFMGRRRR